MKEKISTILLIVFALIAAGVLLSTPSRPVSETTPPTSKPTEITEPPLPETIPDALPRVEDILDRHILDSTAVSHCVFDESLHRTDDLTGADTASPAHALARLCRERKMNPISAFWVLKEEGLYRKTTEGNGKLAVPAVQPPEAAAKDYPYSAEGVREFLTELLTLSAMIDDGLPVDIRVLGEDKAVEQVYPETDECHYAYYVCYSPEAAHFLCFYIRGGETITDAEFQLLNLRYAEGDTEALERIDQLGDRQAAALMTAAELLLTGESRAAQGRIPLGYGLGEYEASIERFTITGSGDTGTLTNYRLRK